MAEARQRDEWNRSAALMCLLANVNRDPKQRRRPYEPREFHPLENRAMKPHRPKISWSAFEKLCGLDPE